MRIAPLSAEAAKSAYALNAWETFRFRVAGLNAADPLASSCLRRASSSFSDRRTLIDRFGILISIRSPSWINAISPPEAASGEI